MSDSPAGESWGHDYPMSVQGLMSAATQLMHIEGPVDSTTTLTVNDPELLKHPFAMLTEPGCWSPTDAEVKALRTYLLKGGFLLVDDPTLSSETERTYEIASMQFERWMKQVLPNVEPMRVDVTNAVFNNLFLIDLADIPGLQGTAKSPGQVWGYYQDNDPTKRLIVDANYRTRVGEYWRYAKGLGSGLGEGKNETAYKLGLNYLVYGLTH